MNKDAALNIALAFIERVNRDGWILDSFEPEMYAALAAIKEALAKEWVGLTDEDIKKCIAATIKVTDPLLLDAIQAVVIDVENKLKDKNNGND
jgi:hypothetical protein